MTIPKMGVPSHGAPISHLRETPQKTRNQRDSKPDRAQLDNIGKFTVQSPMEMAEERAEWVKSSRSKLFDVRRTIGTFYDRVKPCGYYPIKKGNDIPVVRGKNKSVFYTQLQQCKSVWACPICNLKISQKNANEVRNMLTNAIMVDGYKAVMITLTVPHTSNEKLYYLEKEVTRTFSEITADVNYKGQYRRVDGVSTIVKDGLKQDFGVQGFIRALECKKSLEHGWHPHAHVIFILDPKTETHIQAFAEAVISLWTEKINKRYKKKARRWAQDYKEVDSISGISDYISKWDIVSELVYSNKKDDGRGLTVFKLIELLMETGEAQYQEDFLTFVKAFKGKHPISPSTGFKKRFLRGIEEKTDEQACKDGEIEELLFSMSYEIFKELRKKRKEANLLNTAQYNPEQVRDFLKEHVPNAINVAAPGDPAKYV